MGEILFHRDERNQIFGLTGRGMEEDGPAMTSARHLLRAAVVSMTDYLHLSPNYSAEEEVRFSLERSDPHLDREINVIMETLVIGLKLLAEEYPNDLVVHEGAQAIQV
ncbi:hypothetical protein LR032_05450 [Candidatus Bipolaricaulota bacterium]|nr:hypothetical protein [Candidatus Bipolaricaulota bacterium]